MVSCTRKVLWLRSAYVSDGSDSFYKTEYICTHEADNQMQYHCEVFFSVHNERQLKTILNLVFQTAKNHIYYIYHINSNERLA